MLNLAGITTRKRYNSQTYDFDPYKRIKLSPTFDVNEIEYEEKPTPFKPRLLRAKRKENNSKVVYANNNNNDDWVKHRRELEISQSR